MKLYRTTQGILVENNEGFLLASDDSSFMTDQALVIDGGWST